MSIRYSRALAATVAQQGAHQAVLERLKANDVLAAREHDPPDGDLVHAADRLAERRHGRPCRPGRGSTA